MKSRKEKKFIKESSEAKDPDEDKPPTPGP